MENIIITQLSAKEIRELFRQELELYFSGRNSEKEVEDKILTIKQAGELVNLSVPTIYGLVSRSEIPYSKKGKRLYFSKSELLDWIKSGRKKTLSEIEAEAENRVNRKMR